MDHGELKMTNPNNHGAAGHRFIELGMLLFLLGLATGFAIPFMSSPRMGLSSHLEGVLNGIFLISLGLIWSRVALPRWAEKLAIVFALFGTFANWLATLLAALWSAGGMTPIAGGGAQGSAGQEAVVGALLLGLSFAMIGLCGLVLWGLRRARGRAVSAEERELALSAPG
jgi:(hydroxyamino)benzene mutase